MPLLSTPHTSAFLLCFCHKDGAPGKIAGKMFVRLCLYVCVNDQMYVSCRRDSSCCFVTSVSNNRTDGGLTILVVCMTCLHDIS